MENLLSSISKKYKSIWSYSNNQWIEYVPNNTDNAFSKLESGRGYWVNMNIPGTLTVNGSTPFTSLTLNRGWNLIGYNSSVTGNVKDVFKSISGKFYSIWAFIDSKWLLYDEKNPGFSDLAVIKPGYGYWINAKDKINWILP
jgi:hypothetical protein